MSDGPGVCFFCDEMMLHCYECEENYCETMGCLGNDETHEWMKCSRSRISDTAYL